MSFANNTIIDCPDTQKPIENFNIGDDVLSGCININSNAITWEPTKINFSAGTDNNNAQQNLIKVQIDNNQAIIVTLDHLFLMRDFKLKRADHLVPGKDQLVTKNGDQISIISLNVGLFKTGIHNIATSTDFIGKIDNHLIISNGVISGDYNLQIHQKDMIGNNHSIPPIGTQEYN